MKKTILFLALVFMSFFGFSQVRLTLEDCIEIALKNNLKLNSSLLDVERQRLVKNKVAFNYLPSINLEASHDYDFGFTIDRDSNRRVADDFLSNEFSLSASMDILNLTKFKIHDQSKIDLKRSETDYEVVKNQMLLTISQYYLEVMFNTEYIEILKNQLKESQNQIDRLNEALSYGYIAKSELYDAEAEYSIDKKAVLLAENNKKRSVLSLLNLINYDKGINEVDFFDILFKIDTTKINNKPDFLKEALKYNPEVLSSNYNLLSAKKEIAINRANGLPKLRLNYQYGTYYTKNLNDEFETAPYNDQLKDHKTQYVGASLKIPLFNALQNQSDIKIAKVEYEKSKLQQEIVKDNVKFAIEQTVQDLENAISAYQTTLDVLNAARESFRTSKLKYEQGKINAFGFATAKKNLLQTEFDLLDSKFKLYFNRLKLNLLTKSY